MACCKGIMAYENGEWIMHGLARSDPARIRTPEELIARIERVGFLPLFRGRVGGLSVEECTAAEDWWTDDPARDPWLWRAELAAGGRVAYGKFFEKKAGFVSLDWFAAFANCRRGGYDFDARWDEGLAPQREKQVMDLFAQGEERFSYEARRLAGFGGEGEKNFEGTVTSLQMQTYLVVRGFRCRVNRSGEPYGWPIAVYTAPESLWGYDRVAAAYGEAPEESRARILRHLRAVCPEAEEQELARLIR